MNNSKLDQSPRSIQFKAMLEMFKGIDSEFAETFKSSQAIDDATATEAGGATVVEGIEIETEACSDRCTSSERRRQMFLARRGERDLDVFFRTTTPRTTGSPKLSKATQGLPGASTTARRGSVLSFVPECDIVGEPEVSLPNSVPSSIDFRLADPSGGECSAFGSFEFE